MICDSAKKNEPKHKTCKTWPCIRRKPQKAEKGTQEQNEQSQGEHKGQCWSWQKGVKVLQRCYLW